MAGDRSMKSMEPHFALKFARRQLELVQNGYSEKEAYQLTEVRPPPPPAKGLALPLERCTRAEREPWY